MGLAHVDDAHPRDRLRELLRAHVAVSSGVRDAFEKE
jgi:hypothetical protein